MLHHIARSAPVAARASCYTAHRAPARRAIPHRRWGSPPLLHAKPAGISVLWFPCRALAAGRVQPAAKRFGAVSFGTAPARDVRLHAKGKGAPPPPPPEEKLIEVCA